MFLLNVHLQTLTLQRNYSHFKGRKKLEKTCHYSKTSMDEMGEPYGYVLNIKRKPILCCVIIPVTEADEALQASLFQIYASHFLRL